MIESIFHKGIYLGLEHFLILSRILMLIDLYPTLSMFNFLWIKIDKLLGMALGLAAIRFWAWLL